MLLTLDRSSRVPVREQIRLEIAQRIRSGLLRPGQRLPSVRVLAETLHISLVTAHQVYKALDREGLTLTRQGKGSFVRETAVLSAEAAAADPYDWQLSVPDSLPRASFWSQSAVRLPPHILDLATAAIHCSLLPLELIQASFRQVLEHSPQSLGCYSSFAGDEQFRQVLTAYLKQQGITVQPHQLLVTNGTQQGIDLFARTFLGPGEIIAVETPCFSGAIDAFRLARATLQQVSVDRDGIRVDLLEDLAATTKVKAVYTVPTGQNPTGAVMSLGRRQDLLQFARSNNILILEDEPHREIELGRKDLPPPLKALDTTGHVVYLKGFSKFLFPGLRLGLLAADGSIFNRLLAAKSITDLGSPLWLQTALIPFFSNSLLPKYLDQLNSVLAGRRQLTIGLLDRLLDRRIIRPRHFAGIHLWLSLPGNVNTDYLIPEAHHRGIHFLPGSIFYAGEPATNHLRICWTNLADADLPRALKILCALLNEALEPA